MARVRVNDVQLFYEEVGEGDPLVLVHGGWVDHSTWGLVVPGLAESFRVVAYDRRGHGQSEHPDPHGPRRDQEDDLAELIGALDCAPAHVVANSFGGSIALGLAARRPELFRSLGAHEPPLMTAFADDPELRPLAQDALASIRSVNELLEAGDVAAATRVFVEQVALGPGTWELVPTTFAS
ncbi:MAG: alpha/beta fold hydrolase [Solirubrobacterales bacterium]